MVHIMRMAGLFLVLFPLLFPGSFAHADPDGASPDGEIVRARVESELAAFRVVRVVDGLRHPWAVDWLPDGRMLITERGGTLYLVDGRQATAVSHMPQVWAENQGGLLDVAVAPDYGETGWIYLTYTLREDGKGGTVLARARLEGTRLTQLEELYRQTPFLEPNYHFGSRIAFLDDGTLLVTLGERGQRREREVDIPTPSTSVGTTVRLHADGSVPDDNPFVGQEGARPEVYSYGHRNAQGMAIQPGSGAIWQHEHGPHGGDELNLIEAGNNYGWPDVSLGDTYRGQQPIGVPSAPGVTDPVASWDPSPAFSGMTFYTGDAFPQWRNDLFMGALAQQKILRIELNEHNQVVHQEALLRGEIGRIRDVAQGPDGHLYVLTDMPDGGLYRLDPLRRPEGGESRPAPQGR
ncbi:PQQ-dependent sugar dehydrogenase [Ectothiorhodospira mobilis]|uniref:PQQ-dependent sugar dehydrogenase n=1 Tax=Ectothiorhodospira mobilis TaxID=195064 RepID=UPI0019087CE9|nr:PQQ-dependent sugar dehydrogenase [Ectothiorhodospira mobilis]MBK1691978.1 pyrroloquinoline-quinone glucose dehydrogenase [Ectothiorhodospira mobilis]